MRRLAFATIVLCLTLIPRLYAQTERGYSIAGHVYFQDSSHPAKFVSATVQTISHQYLLSDVTSETGSFHFTGLKLSQYILLVQADGYETVSLNLDLSFDDANGLSIYLKPRQNAQKVPLGPKLSVHQLSMPAKAQEFLDSGEKKLYQDRDAKAAVSDFQQALAIAPTFFEVSYQLGIAYLILGNSTEAEAAFRKSIESSGHTYAEPFVRLGAILTDRGDLSTAEQTIRDALKLNSNLWLGHYELGRVLLQEKRLPEALLSADQARLLAPSSTLVYRLLSNIHLLQKDYPALLEDLNTYIAIDPDSPAGLRAKQFRDQLQAQFPAPTSTHP